MSDGTPKGAPVATPYARVYPEPLTSSCCAHSVWTFLAERIITKFTHPFNPIRSGGVRCPDDQAHICHSETYYSMMPKCCDFQCLFLRHVLTKF